MTTVVNCEVFMYPIFLSLKEEKQKTIINAAMDEFAKKGYQHASTNEIVRKAGISKGSLFHYFGSKQVLAEFLIHYSLNLFEENIVGHLEHMTGDIIERWRDIVLLKLKLISEYPLIFAFMLRILNEENEDIKNSLNDSRDEFIEKFKNKVYTGLDHSKFREDVDVGKALKLIYWGLEGYAAEVQRKIGDSRIPEELIDQSLNECNEYLDMFKRIFYR